MAKHRVAIIAASGGRDAAYKALNIATAAAAMGDEAAIFFTFEGLRLIHKELYSNLPLPPGMAGMEGALAASGVPSIPELAATAREMGVQFVACQMTMDLMGIQESDLLPGVKVGGAATFLAYAYGADVTLSF